MSDEHGDNVWDDLPQIEDGISGQRLVRTEGRPLAGAVWELQPGADGVDFHFHHGTEEYLIILRGTATLRTYDGEREVREGTVVHFPPGREGAHTVMNRSDAPVRYLIVAAHASPDIIEYPDKGTFVAGAKTPSQDGQPFFVRLPIPEPE